MSIRIGIVDYGMGNLHSVAKACARPTTSVSVTDDRQKLQSMDLLVLPGVGSFGAAMTTLAKKKLDDFIVEWIKSSRFYLGICLGYQLLFESSEESPGVPGLGVLKGKVKKFTGPSFSRKKLSVPHMGWNTAAPSTFNGKSLFKRWSLNDYFYFVHSFYPVPKDPAVKFTQTSYGLSFCSSVMFDRAFASQFHPEKSGNIGQNLLSSLIHTVQKGTSS